MASASDLQEQELTFYSDNIHSLISPQKSLTLILHEPSNYPSWLNIGIAQQSLSNNNECYLSPQSPSYSKKPCPTFLYSFSETEQTYSKYVVKYITQNKEMFNFISFLADSSISEDKWNIDLCKKIEKSLETSASTPTVILENPELLLSIIPDLTIPKLLSQIMEIQKVATLYIISSTTSINSSDFINSLLHRSSIIISLTALTTGRADDITGILSISKGPVHDCVKSKKLCDRQYAYFVSTNNVKLYYK